MWSRNCLLLFPLAFCLSFNLQVLINSLVQSILPCIWWQSPYIRLSMHIIATGLYASNFLNHIGGVMVSVFASEWYIVGSSPDRVKPKTIIGICCFSAHNAASRSKSKNLFLRNQDNVSAWSGMSFHSLLFQWASTMHFQLSVLI